MFYYGMFELSSLIEIEMNTHTHLLGAQISEPSDQNICVS